jgi:putative transposase
LSSADVDDAMSRLDMSRSVLYKLIQRYKQRPQTSSLLPRKRGRGNNVTLLEDEREKLLDDCIREFYLTHGKDSCWIVTLHRDWKAFEAQLSDDGV